MLQTRTIQCTQSTMSSNWQDTILDTLDKHHVTLFDLLVFTLRTQLPRHAHNRAVLQTRTEDILDLWSEQFPSAVQQWSVKVATETYRMELMELIQPHAGFHFRGSRACLDQLESFSMVETGNRIKHKAPNLWDLLGILLDANPDRRRAKPQINHVADEDVEMDLGEIGGLKDDWEQWHKLLSDDEESDGEHEDDADDNAPATLSSDEDDNSEDEGPVRSEKKKRRRQNPAKRNAVLLAVVSGRN
jgi:hypothetical protein